MSAPERSPDLPPLHWRGMLHVLRFLPQGALSRGFGHIADIPLAPALRRPVLSAFARMMNIDAGEAEHDFDAYGSINEFFVRRLRAGARTIDARDGHIVSPVDGVVGRFGDIRDGELLQAKGRTYTTAALLGDRTVAATFNRGSFLTIYLSPRHYHRIHAPLGGVITRADHIPGALLPVNGPSVQHVAQLFPRNERLLCYIAGPMGMCAVVAVGAYNVGRISAAFDRTWRDGAAITNRAGARTETRRYDRPLPVERGQEIMAFHLGSTVVLLFEHAVPLEPRLTPGMEVRLGSSIATLR